MAGANDKFTKSYSFLQKSLGATISDVATSLTLNNYTNIPTDTKVHFIIDRIDSNGNRTNSKRELVSGICNGSAVTNLSRGLHGTTAQSHDAGAVVEFVLSGAAWNDLIDGILVEHNQDGTHSTVTATSVTTTGGVVVGDDIRVSDGKSINDGNDNELVVFQQTASAVNEVEVTNAATGNAPQIAATGDDTNIDILLNGKGTGVVSESRRYQTDNSNSISSTTGSAIKIQMGWGQAQGGGSSSQTEAVTFPTAFTTVLGVSISYMGQTSGSSAASDITGITNTTAAPVTTQSSGITTSGFNATMYLATGSFSTTRYYSYSWLAWGI